MSVVLVATIVPKPEFRDEVIRLLETAIGKTHADETGIELYALHEGRDRLVMIEKYVDNDALKAHGKGASIAELGAGLEDKLESPLDIQVLTPHPTGDVALGAL